VKWNNFLKIILNAKGKKKEHKPQPFSEKFFLITMARIFLTVKFVFLQTPFQSLRLEGVEYHYLI